MFDQGSGTQDQIQRWEQLERDMTALYYREKNAAKEKAEEEDWDMGSDRVVCRVESTGYVYFDGWFNIIVTLGQGNLDP